MTMALRPNVPNNIILIGMMGSGKTTIGRLVAWHLGMDFVDADHELEKVAGRKINQIFATDGEAEFRRLESQILADLCSNTDQVIATGGGAILSQANVHLLRSAGTIVFINVSAEELVRRLKNDCSRPLLQNGDPVQKIRDLLELRLPLYRAVADLEFISTDIAPGVTAKILSTKLANMQEKRPGR